MGLRGKNTLILGPENKDPMVRKDIQGYILVFDVEYTKERH